MDIAAVCLWSITALVGLILLGTWIAKGGVRRAPSGRGRHRRLPRSLVLGHPLLAAAGLVFWVAYLTLPRSTLSWVAFGILVPAAALGAVMFIRWVPTYRGRVRFGTGPGAAAHRAGPAHRAAPEEHFPLVVVVAHGAFAVVTVVLVLLATLGSG